MPFAAASAIGSVYSEFATDERWPLFTEKARKSPASAVLAVPLSAVGHPGIVLNLYGDDLIDPEHILDGKPVLIGGFGLALTAITRREKTENLQVALHTNRRIGAAIGVLMHRYRWTESQAFDTMRQISQQTHTKLSDVADEVLLIGDLGA